MNKFIALILAVFVSLMVVIITGMLFKDGLGASRNDYQALGMLTFVGVVPSVYYYFAYGAFFLKSELLRQAEEELEDGSYDKEAWAKALMTSRGNEEVRRAEYLKHRARQLS